MFIREILLLQIGLARDNDLRFQVNIDKSKMSKAKCIFSLFFYLKKRHLCVPTKWNILTRQVVTNPSIQRLIPILQRRSRACIIRTLQNQTRGRQGVGMEKKGKESFSRSLPLDGTTNICYYATCTMISQNTAIARRSSVYTDTTRSQTNITIPHGGVECFHYASNEGNHETGLIDRSTITKCYTFVCALHSRKWTRSQSSRWDILLTFRQTRGFTVWIFSLPYTGCSARNNSIDTSTAV